MEMARYRSVYISFWTDSKVVDDFTPEDKYFYLYLMTNPHTNLCGCYELSLKQASDETGYSKETIVKLLDRMENIHDVIKYCKETKEILILNWRKYNWTKSPDFQKPLIKEIESVKNAEFSTFLHDCIDGLGTVSRRSQDGVGTTVSVTVSDSETDNKNSDTIKEIVVYLNSVCGTNYKPTADKTKKHINARISEGYVLDDFKKVIDVKHDEWENTEWEKFLRPETLFGTKFEGYLNQVPKKKEISKQEDTQEEPIEEDDEEWSDERWEEEFRKRGL